MSSILKFIDLQMYGNSSNKAFILESVSYRTNLIFKQSFDKNIIKLSIL